MKINAKTDIGAIRSTNEDAYTYQIKDENNYIAFVCDGMGGHLGGSFASNKTIEVINDAYAKLDTNSNKNIGVWLFSTLQEANSLVYEKSISNENLKGMGTTVTGVICFNGEIYYAHVGDSRIYIFNNVDELSQVTTDHTYVNTLLLNGLITYKQSLKHPKRHVLTNALGIKKDVSVDIGQIKLKDNDNLLICTDGLHNMVDNKKLTKILSNGELTIQQKIDELISKALQQGGTDNITLIILEK